MSGARMRMAQARKHIELVRRLQQEAAHLHEPGPVREVAPEAAYRRAQINRNELASADLLVLQRTVGNRQVRRMVVQRIDNTNDEQQRTLAVLPSVSSSNSPVSFIQRQVETWFRGEATGVAPATSGGVVHDFGDGFYLTDDPNVAARYAALRAGGEPAIGRVLSTTFKRSVLGRVLDLTQDVRWQRFVQAKSPSGVTYKQLIQMANENYWKFFQAFLKQHNLQLRGIDAIIGPEYVRGGNQICIRNPKIAARIRAKLQFVAPGTLPTGGVSGGGVRTKTSVANVRLATPLLGLLGGLLAGWYLQRVKKKEQEASLKRQTKALELELEKQLKGPAIQNGIRALRALDPAEKLYAHVTIAVETITTLLGQFGPFFYLRSVGVTAIEMPHRERRYQPVFAPGASKTRADISFTVPLELVETPK